jgi:hypothetical protein
MFNQRVNSFWAKAVLTIGAVLVSSALSRPATAAAGAVYTMNNSAAGNGVVMYSRSADGTLRQPESSRRVVSAVVGIGLARRASAYRGRALAACGQRGKQ